ncbi:MAG: archease [Thaumarchaeota archaeon]|nr:archease [Nitrososphaerota archaeon]
MSIQYLEHTTDAFILVTAPSLTDAFTLAGQSVVDTTLDKKTIEEKEQRTLTVSGKDLRYLLFNWLEEVNYQLITEGFAIARFSLDISKNSTYELKSTIFGEPIDLKKHHFKVEIKAPTFHMMEIKQNGQVTMRFLLDL